MFQFPRQRLNERPARSDVPQLHAMTPAAGWGLSIVQASRALKNIRRLGVR
jgi:hypothetical protein